MTPNTEGADARFAPAPVYHAETGDLDDDARLGAKALHSLAPKRKARFVALERHAGMVDDDQRLRIAAGNFDRLADLRGIELEIE